MNELQKPDEEHFFFRQEMRCKEVLAESPLERGLFWLFRQLSDYGGSVSRPLWGLIFLFLVGVAANWGYFSSSTAIPPVVADSKLGSAIGLSFGPLFSFLGINRLYFADLLRSLPDVLKAYAAVQTVFGFILLFFLGLSLRNHFRLK